MSDLKPNVTATFERHLNCPRWVAFGLAVYVYLVALGGIAVLVVPPLLVLLALAGSQ